ncbi:hypothetical protein LCGC14_3130850, partial [marine sediment metagenome]
MANDLLKQAKDLLNDMSSMEVIKDYLGSVSMACVIEDKEPYKVYNIACFHPFLSWGGHADYLIFWPFARKKFEHTYPSLVKEINTKITENEKEFIKYIVKRSVFAKCFVTKSFRTVWNKGAILDTKFSAQMVYSAASSIRLVSEYPYVIENWNVFRKFVDDDVAFIFAHFFVKNKENSYIKNIYFGGSHTWINSANQFGKIELKNILNRRSPMGKQLPSFKEKPDYRNATRLWSEGNWSDRYETVPNHQKIEWPEGDEIDDTSR